MKSMSKFLIIVSLALGLLIGLVVFAQAQLKPATGLAVRASTASVHILNDFETFVWSEWFQYGDYGSGTSVTFAPTVDATRPGSLSGNHVLSITYTSRGWGAGVGRNLNAEDWSAYDGFSFWFRGFNSGATFRVILSDNKSGPGDTAERFAYEFVDNSAGWRHISIPWALFFRDFWQPDGAPNDGLTLTEMWAYAIALPSGTNGTVFVDDVALFKLDMRNDFETFVWSEWFQYGDYGSGTSIAFAPVVDGTRPGGIAGNHVLSVTYTSRGWGAGVGRNLDAEDWSAYDGFSFWFRGFNSGATFRVILSDNKSGPGDTAERFAYEFVDNSAGWRHISIPWALFFRDFWQPDGAPNDGLTLTEMWAYAIALPSGTNGTVFIDDVALFGGLMAPPQPVVDFAQAAYTVNEDAGPAVIAVTLDPVSTWPLTVSYSTAAGTATPGHDYTAVSGELTFAPGQSVQTFTVPITDDAVYESNEDLTLILSDGSGTLLIGRRNNPATLTIIDDELPPDVRVVDDFESGIPLVRTPFGGEVGFTTWGNVPGNVTITTTVVTTQNATLMLPGQAVTNTILQVNYNIAGGGWGGFTHAFTDGRYWTSQDWSRYDGLRFWLYGNNTGGTIQIDLFDNQALGSTGDSAERFYYRITDDYTGWRQFSIPFSAFRRRTDWQPGGAPNDGLNLTEVSGYAFGFPAGVGAQVAYVDQVELYGDLSQHPVALRVQFHTYAYAVNEGEAEAFQVTLNETSTLPVTVTYTIAAGSATAGVDYTPVASGTLTFAPGETVQTIVVTSLEDGRVEPAETVNATLSDPVNAALGWRDEAPLYIMDDDVPDPSVVDDFESGVPVSLRTSGGVTVTAVEIASDSPLALPGQDPINTVLSVTYNLPALRASAQAGAGGFIRTFDTPRDWSGYEGFSFWFYGMNTGNELTVQLLDNAAPDPGPGGWELAWSDEFDGPAGAAPDPTKWGYDIGGWGWGNREWQYYTDKRENSALDGAGHMVITATENTTTTYQCAHTPPNHEPGVCAYTSARLLTRGKFEFAYGRAEARIRIPEGQGIWPAFWMLGNNFGQVGWPGCGEIDIMENIGREPNTVHGTVHGPGYSGGSGIGGGYTITEPFASDYHTFAVEWEPEEIRWYVDNTQYFTVTPSMLPAGAPWVFDHPFFIIMNVAVGGYWPGYPDATTVFPQTMSVDYVRVYQAPDTAERFEATFTDNFTGWRKVTIPFTSFRRSAEQPTGAPDDGLTLTEVHGYGFGMPAGSRGSFYLDMVRLVELQRIYLPVVLRNS